jgi:hypothetical protein
LANYIKVLNYGIVTKFKIAWIDGTIVITGWDVIFITWLKFVVELVVLSKRDLKLISRMGQLFVTTH